MTDRPTPGQLEERAAIDPAAAPTVDGRRLRGLIPFRVESRDLGGWREVIEPGALRAAKLDDLVARVDHAGVPLARHPGTLDLDERSDGLHWSCELPESRSDVREAVERGVLRSTSWQMVVGRDEWRGKVRHVHEIAELRDVSVVTSPAYAEARAEYRSEPGPEPTSAAIISEPDPQPEPEEQAMPATEEKPAGGLTVEARAAQDQPNVEARVLEAIASVRKGESRDLSTANASAVTPPELSTYLWDLLYPQSALLSAGIQVVTTDRESVVYPRLVQAVDPSWVAEGAVIPEGDPVFGTLTATPRKLAHRVVLTNEIISDSVPSILDVLKSHLAKMMALKLDLSLLQGSGTPPVIRGLANQPGVQTIASMGANGSPLNNLDPIVQAVAAVEGSNARPTAIIMHSKVWEEAQTIKDANGRYLIEQEASEGAQRSLFGVPVYVSNQISLTEARGTNTDTSSIWVIDASQVVMVRRQDFSLEIDRSRLFDRDESEVRVKLRADLILPNPQAVARVVGVR